MKTLILYSSRYGTTKNCAENLKEILKGNTVIAEINSNVKMNMNKYDNIIIGASVYDGKIAKEVLEFLKDYKGMMQVKNSGVYLCSLDQRKEEKYFKKNISKDILKVIGVMSHFGGEAKYGNMKFTEKIKVKSLTKSLNNSEINIKEDFSMLNGQAMKRFAANITKMHDRKVLGY